tara:strand:- start:5285 stop:5926 length:642 start_codon:yes stop_codon:yes gene_type:complete
MEEPVQVPKRQTAFKVWIRDLKHTKGEMEDGGLVYLPIGGHNVVRVNIVGSVIGKNVTDNFGSLVIDDGSDNIQARVWGDDLWLVNEMEVGDLVLIVARLGEFNQEPYLRPEVVRKIDMDWALLRRLELIKEYGKPDAVEEKKDIVVEKVEEVEPSLAVREKVLAFVEEGDEISMEALVEKVGLEEAKVKKAVDELLKEGEMFMPRPGFLRCV